MASSDSRAIADPAAVLAEARRWINTPYHHQAAVRGVGCDCVGLVRGVYTALGCGAVGAVPAYSRDWGDATGNEGVLAAARAHLVELPAADAGPGHVVVLRWRERQLAKHAGDPRQRHFHPRGWSRTGSWRPRSIRGCAGGWSLRSHSRAGRG